jgi:large subunit ribosomal protein L24e
MACSFCGKEVPKGSEYVFAKKDGTILMFCSSKCKSNQLGLKRVGKKAPWVRRRKDASETKKAKKK